jgi:hypothetical protein
MLSQYYNKLEETRKELERIKAERDAAIKSHAEEQSLAVRMQQERDALTKQRDELRSEVCRINAELEGRIHRCAAKDAEIERLKQENLRLSAVLKQAVAKEGACGPDAGTAVAEAIEKLRRRISINAALDGNCTLTESDLYEIEKEIA